MDIEALLKGLRAERAYKAALDPVDEDNLAEIDEQIAIYDAEPVEPAAEPVPGPISRSSRTRKA